MDSFVYDTVPSRVVFGNGASRALEHELERHGVDRPLVLCTPGGRRRLSATGALTNVTGVEVFDAVEPNVPAHTFEAALARLRDVRGDGLVSFGGGSSIGLGKALAAANGLPLVAIVTTYSGSEMSQAWAVGTGKERRRGSDLRALPRAVVYDPELTLGLPSRLSVASGMNAMAHAVESLYGANLNPVTALLAEEAIGLLGAALPSLALDPRDLGARSSALHGAWLAAAFRAQSGLAHAIAQRVRQRFDLDHAHTHAIVLPYVTAFNGAAAPVAMARVCRARDTDDAAGALFDISVRAGLETGLGKIGMKEGDIDEVVDLVVQANAPNPRPAGSEDIRNLLEQAFVGERPFPAGATPPR